MELWQRVFNIVLLGIGSLFCVLFIVRYTTSQRGWWKNPIGQLLITMSAAVGAFYLWGLLITLWPTVPGRSIMRTILFLTLTGSIIWRYIIFARLNRVIKRDKELHSVRVVEEDEPDA